MQNPLPNGCGNGIRSLSHQDIKSMLLVLYLFVLKFGAGFVWGLFAAVATPPTPLPSCPEPHPAAAARARGLRVHQCQVPAPRGTGSCLWPSAQPGRVLPMLRLSCLDFRLISLLFWWCWESPNLSKKLKAEMETNACICSHITNMIFFPLRLGGAISTHIFIFICFFQAS